MRRFRQRLRQWEPQVLQRLSHPRLAGLRRWLDGQDVLRFSREPLARGVGIGLLCGLIPGPLQVVGSLCLCVWLRGNLVAAAVATVYTNPLTIVPLYWLAFQIGAALLPGHWVMPPLQVEQSGLQAWAEAVWAWMPSLGWPLAVGLPVLAASLAALGYATVQALFLHPVWARIRRRRAGG